MHHLLDLGFLNMLNANTSLGLAVKCQSSCRHSWCQAVPENRPQSFNRHREAVDFLNALSLHLLSLHSIQCIIYPEATSATERPNLTNISAGGGFDWWGKRRLRALEEQHLCSSKILRSRHSLAWTATQRHPKCVCFSTCSKSRSRMLSTRTWAPDAADSGLSEWARVCSVGPMLGSDGSSSMY